jgi:hypothetical protein
MVGFRSEIYSFLKNGHLTLRFSKHKAVFLQMVDFSTVVGLCELFHDRSAVSCWIALYFVWTG